MKLLLTAAGISNESIRKIHPHLDHEWFPANSLANLEKISIEIPYPSYAIDDQTALKIIDGKIEVISERNWKLFENK